MQQLKAFDIAVFWLVLTLDYFHRQSHLFELNYFIHSPLFNIFVLHISLKPKWCLHTFFFHSFLAITPTSFLTQKLLLNCNESNFNVFCFQLLRNLQFRKTFIPSIFYDLQIICIGFSCTLELGLCGTILINFYTVLVRLTLS